MDLSVYISVYTEAFEKIGSIYNELVFKMPHNDVVFFGLQKLLCMHCVRLLSLVD